LDARPSEVPVIRDFLAPHKEQVVDKLWAVVEKPGKGQGAQRLRAAAALAKFNPESQRWAKEGEPVANDLVSVPLVYLVAWMESFRPVREQLLSPLSALFRDQRPERASERSLAANLLTDYAAEQPHLLADLLLDADDKQFAVIFAKFKEQGEKGLPLLTGEI